MAGDVSLGHGESAAVFCRRGVPCCKSSGRGLGAGDGCSSRVGLDGAVVITTPMKLDFLRASSDSIAGFRLRCEGRVRNGSESLEAGGKPGVEVPLVLPCEKDVVGGVEVVVCVRLREVAEVLVLLLVNGLREAEVEAVSLDSEGPASSPGGRESPVCCKTTL